MHVPSTPTATNPLRFFPEKRLEARQTALSLAILADYASGSHIIYLLKHISGEHERRNTEYNVMFCNLTGTIRKQSQSVTRFNPRTVIRGCCHSYFLLRRSTAKVWALRSAVLAKLSVIIPRPSVKMQSIVFRMNFPSCQSCMST
jgi:hypothetical protein